MKIKFIGVPGERHESISQYGMSFPLDKEVEVKNPEAVRKLSNHPHFKAVADDVSDVDFKEVDPLKPSRQELEDLAKTLDIKADGRWSDERLQAEIAKKA